MRAERLWGVCLSVASVLFASRSEASPRTIMPVVPPSLAVGNVRGLYAMEQTPLVVTQEWVSFQCAETRNGLECDVEARAQLRNTTSEPLHSRYGVDLPRGSLWTDTSRVQWTPNEAGVGLEVLVPPASELTIHARGKRQYSQVEGAFYVDALRAEHPLLFTPNTVPMVGRLAYQVQGSVQEQVSRPLDVQVTLPAHWDLDAREGWTAVGEHSYTRTVTGSLDVMVHRLRGAAVIRSGGPFLALGARVRPADFALRGGYGWGLGYWGVGDVDLSTDFRSFLTIGGTIGVATPSFVLLPSVGVGVGVPVRVWPSVDVGFRVVVRSTFYSAGVDVVLDYFPMSNQLVPAVYARIGL